MRRIPGVLKTVVLATCVSWTAHAKTFNLEHDHVPGELIVRFDSSLEKSTEVGILKSLGAQAAHTYKSSGAQLLKFSNKAAGKDLLAIAERLAKTPGVRHVEANTIMRIDATLPNDARFAELYGMHNEGQTGGTADADIDAPEAWDITTGSRNVVVAVIDTGIDYNHPDIAANYWTNPGETGMDADGNDKSTNGIDDDGNGYIDDFRGWDFVNDDNDPMDDNAHGTHCAGTIGGSGNDGTGVAGVNWEVSLVGVKFLSGGGSGTLDDAVKAIEYTTSLGVDLTSNSWGGGGFSETMDAAIRAADAADILFIAAAGNSGSNNDSSPHYPSSYEADNVISVAATDHNDNLASFSCFGIASVDLAAPGVDILSSTPDNSYDSYSGTSMATPHVAGVAALVKSLYPEATAAQLKARILNTVDPIAGLSGKVATGGRVNAFNALENDSIAPGLATELSVMDTGLTTVQLQWKAAGDDGDEGLASRYEIRYAESMIDDSNWDLATSVSVTIDSDAEGVLSGTIRGFAFNTTGYLAIRAIDNVGNIGPVSESVAFAVKEVEKIAENTADSLDGVTADMPWGIEETDNGNNVFSDSPGTQYENDLDIALTLDPIMLSSADATLAISTYYDFESGYDFGYIEVSTDGGATFQELEKLTGTATAWETKTYDLSALLSEGETSLVVRFRMTTDYSVTRDGWKIDNVLLFAPRQ